jgi:hypothetical protein
MHAVTTIARLRHYNVLANEHERLLAALAENRSYHEQIPIADVLRIAGLNAAIRCLCATDAPTRLFAQFAHECALSVAKRLQPPPTEAAAEAAAYSYTGAKGAAEAAALAEAAVTTVTAEAAAKISAGHAESAAASAAFAAAAESEAAYFAERDWQRTLFVEMFCSEDA